MLAIIMPFLKLLVGEALALMLRAFIVNARVERGTDPALLQEIDSAVKEAMGRTDLNWAEKLILVRDRVGSWMKELRKDLLAATSKTMLNTLTELKLNELWDRAEARAGRR